MLRRNNFLPLNIIFNQKIFFLTAKYFFWGDHCVSFPQYEYISYVTISFTLHIPHLISYLRLISHMVHYDYNPPYSPNLISYLGSLTICYTYISSSHIPIGKAQCISHTYVTIYLCERHSVFASLITPFTRLTSNSHK